MRALCVSLSIFLLFGASIAHAQDRKKAEQKFLEADKAYKAGDYTKAVQGFLEAYQIVPTNPLLFNIGQAYRLAGDSEKALSYYEKYVAFEPGGPQVPEAKDHIQKLKEEVETARREKERLEAERRAQEEAAAAQRAEEERRRNQELVKQQRAEAGRAGRGLRTGGLVVGGIGVAAVVAGAVLAATDGFDAKSGAALGVGGAALVAGGVLYYLGVKQRSDAEARVGKVSILLPTLTPDAVGVAWLTTF
jgi:tetratricopeptide (TPR) repeat protein